MPCLNAAEALTDARPLKVGLVGCGGRGLGAMKNALDADPGTVVWALADVFRERIDFGSNLLTEQYGSRVFQIGHPRPAGQEPPVRRPGRLQEAASNGY